LKKKNMFEIYNIFEEFLVIKTKALFPGYCL
jgi:hypothetical protein